LNGIVIGVLVTYAILVAGGSPRAADLWMISPPGDLEAYGLSHASGAATGPTGHEASERC
jgi:hypothetical protein